MKTRFAAVLLLVFCAATALAGPVRRVRDGSVLYVVPAGVPSGDVELIRTALRAALDELAVDFPELRRASLRVTLSARTGDYTVRTGQPWWHGASYRDGEITLQPVSVLRERDILRKTLRHEAAHHAFWLAARDKPPLWLIEGFCSLFGGDMKATPAEQDNSLAAFPSLKSLEAGLRQFKDMKRAEKAYRVAWMFTRKLEREFGRKKLAAVLRATGQGAPVESAFRKNLAATPDLLFRNFLRSGGKRVRS